MLRLRWTIQPYQQHIRFSSGLAFVEKWFIYWFLQQIIWQLTQWGEPTSRMQLQWRIIEKQKAFSNNWSRVWWNFSLAKFFDCLRVQWNLYIKLHTCFLLLCFLSYYYFFSISTRSSGILSVIHRPAEKWMTGETPPFEYVRNFVSHAQYFCCSFPLFYYATPIMANLLSSIVKSW